MPKQDGVPQQTPCLQNVNKPRKNNAIHPTIIDSLNHFNCALSGL